MPFAEIPQTLANFVTTSNNNEFYAGTPSTSHLLYFDGSNSMQTITAYKALVTPRDSASISEIPTFLSTTGTSSNFLDMDPSASTRIESGAANIAGFTDDFDGNTRQGNTGYTGTGTARPNRADDHLHSAWQHKQLPFGSLPLR